MLLNFTEQKENTRSPFNRFLLTVFLYVIEVLLLLALICAFVPNNMMEEMLSRMTLFTQSIFGEPVSIYLYSTALTLSEAVTVFLPHPDYACQNLMTCTVYDTIMINLQREVAIFFFNLLGLMMWLIPALLGLIPIGISSWGKLQANKATVGLGTAVSFLWRASTATALKVTILAGLCVLLAPLPFTIVIWPLLLVFLLTILDSVIRS